MELEQIYTIVTSIIAICSVISAITPNTWDNAVVAILRKIVQLGGLNVLFAKPEEKE